MIAQPGDSGKEDSALHASQSRQVVTNTFTAWAGTAVNGIVGFLLVPFLLMRLGKDGYGLASLIGSVIGLTALADLGLRGALSRHLAEHVARRDEKSFNETLSSAMLVYLLIGGTLTLACFFCETPVAQWFRISSDSLAAGRTLIRWYAAPMILFGFLSPLFSGTIVALARLDVLNTLGFLVAVTRGAGLVFALGPMNGGLFGWAVVTFASTLLSLFATAWMAHRLWPSLRLALRFVRFDALRPLFSLGGYLFTLQITMVASMQSDPIVIGRFLGTGAIALYNPGLSLVSVCRPLITALSDQLSPFATYYHVQDQQERLQQLLIRGTRYTFLLGILAFSFVGVFSEPIMKVWLHGSLGAEYAVAAQVLFLWSLVDLGTYAMGTQWAVMLASKRLATVTGLAVVLATLNIGASIYLVSSTKLGVVSVVLPTVVQRLITLAILGPYSAKLCGLTVRAYFVSSYLRPIIVGAGVGAGALGLREYINPVTYGVLAVCGLAVTVLWYLLSWNIGLSGSDRSAFTFHFLQISRQLQLATTGGLGFIISLCSGDRYLTLSRSLLPGNQTLPDNARSGSDLPEPRNFYLWGWSGQLNTGDDAFVAVGACQLRKLMGGDRIAMDGDISGKVSRLCDVITAEPGRLQVPGTTRIRRWYLRKRSSSFVLAGGSLLADAAAVDGLLGDRFWQVGDRGMFAIGLSVGPFQSTMHERKTRELLKRMKYVALRDESSTQWAQAQGLDIPVISAFDLAVLLPEIEVAHLPRENRSKAELRLAVSLLGRKSIRQAADLSKDLEFAEHLGRATASLVKGRGIRLCVMSLCRNPRYDDLPVSQAFAKAFAPGTVEMIEHDGDPRRILDKLRDCTHCVAMRLHGSVLAYTAELPFLMLSYHQKCIDFSKTIGLDERFLIDLTADEFDVRHYQKCLEALLESEPQNYSLPLKDAEIRALRNFQPNLMA